MSAERRFFRDVMLACGLAFGSVAATNFLVDPFGMNPLFRLELAREELAPLYNARLYKLARWEETRAPRVVLGDSRCDQLESAYFAEAGLPSTFNASFGGATGYEVVDAFWYLARRQKLERVILCLPFTVYDEANARNGVPDALSLLEHPLAYYLSPMVLRASGALVWKRLTGESLRTGRPDMTEEAFWAHQLGPDVAGSLRFWRAPRRLRDGVAEIVEYARTNDVALVFVMPPSHVDLQRRVDDFGLRTEYERVKTELAGMAPLVDFDREDARTRDRANYRDPFHVNEATARAVTRELAEELRRQGWPVEAQGDPPPRGESGASDHQTGPY